MSDAGAPPTEVALGLAEDADAVSVAPNWKLVWWRFRKHRLAVVCGVIVICSSRSSRCSRASSPPRGRM